MLINNLLMPDFEPLSRHPATGLFQPGCAQRGVSPEGSPKKRLKMQKISTFPGDSQRSGEKCGLGLRLHEDAVLVAKPDPRACLERRNRSR